MPEMSADLFGDKALTSLVTNESYSNRRRDRRFVAKARPANPPGRPNACPKLPEDEKKFQARYLRLERLSIIRLILSSYSFLQRLRRTESAKRQLAPTPIQKMRKTVVSGIK
jgi:hypothetical protein